MRPESFTFVLTNPKGGRRIGFCRRCPPPTQLACGSFHVHQRTMPTPCYCAFPCAFPCAAGHRHHAHHATHRGFITVLTTVSSLLSSQVPPCRAGRALPRGPPPLLLTAFHRPFAALLSASLEVAGRRCCASCRGSRGSRSSPSCWSESPPPPPAPPAPAPREPETPCAATADLSFSCVASSKALVSHV